MRVVAVAGTGTDVGKTYVAAALLRRLRDRGVDITARKPVQSFATRTAPNDTFPNDTVPNDTVPNDTASTNAASTDADILAAACGAAPYDVCPPHRWLPLPMAPPMAAEALGREPFTIAQLAAEAVAGVSEAGRVLVETAGGVRSPIATDGDSVALIAALTPAVVVLVADAGLGTINLVRLSRDALWKQRVVVVYLNRFDDRSDLHVRNAEWLRTREGLDVVTDIEALATFVERTCA